MAVTFLPEEEPQGVTFVDDEQNTAKGVTFIDGAAPAEAQPAAKTRSLNDPIDPKLAEKARTFVPPGTAWYRALASESKQKADAERPAPPSAIALPDGTKMPVHANDDAATRKAQSEKLRSFYSETLPEEVDGLYNEETQTKEKSYRFKPEQPPAARIWDKVVIDPKRYDDGVQHAWVNGWLDGDQAAELLVNGTQVRELQAERERLIAAAGDNPELKALLTGGTRGAVMTGAAYAGGRATAAGAGLFVKHPMAVGGAGLLGGTVSALAGAYGYDKALKELAKSNEIAAAMEASAKLRPSYAHTGELAAFLVPAPGSAAKLLRGTALVAETEGGKAAAKFLTKQVAGSAAVGAGVDLTVRAAGKALGAEGFDFDTQGTLDMAALAGLLAGHGLHFKNYSTPEVMNIVQRGIAWERAKAATPDGQPIRSDAKPLASHEQAVFDEAVRQVQALRGQQLAPGEQWRPDDIQFRAEQVGGIGGTGTRVETAVPIERAKIGQDGAEPTPAPAAPASPAQSEFESQLATTDAVKRGAPTVVLGANGAEFPAVYAWAPRNLLQASHTGETLANNPQYPLTNTRDYSDQAEKDKVLATRNAWDPRRAVTDSPDAAVGPPMVARVIDESGVASLAVVGGNNRQWAMQNLSPEKWQATQQLTNAKAANFGLEQNSDPEAQLVRHLGTFDFRKPGERERLQGMVDALNPSPGMVQGTAKRAEIDAAAVPLDRLAGLSMEIGPADAQAAVRGLIEGGLADRNRTASIAASAGESQDYVQRLLVNAAFRSPAVAEARGDTRAGAATLRGIVDAAVPALISLRGKGAEGAAVADSITRAFTTVIDATRSQGAETLPQALETVAAQQELDPVHAPAQEIARQLAAGVVRDAKGRVQPEPTIEKARELFGKIDRAVQQHSSAPDLFGESRPIEQTVLAGTRVQEEPGAGYLEAHGVTEPARRAAALEEFRQWVNILNDAGLQKPYQQLNLNFGSAGASGVPAGGGGSGIAGQVPGRGTAAVRRHEEEAGARALEAVAKGLAITPAEIDAALQGGGETISSIAVRLINDPAAPVNWIGKKITCAADFALLKRAMRNPVLEVVHYAIVHPRTKKVMASGVANVGAIAESVLSTATAIRAAGGLPPLPGGQKYLVYDGHNHPSGIPTPSSADQQIYPRLTLAYEGAGLKHADHVITNGHEFFSMGQQTTLPYPGGPTLAAWEILPRHELERINDEQDLKRIANVLRTGSPDHYHVIHGTTQMRVAAVQRLPGNLGVRELVQSITKEGSRQGSRFVWISSPHPASSERAKLRGVADALLLTRSIGLPYVLDAATPDKDSFRQSNWIQEEAPTYGSAGAAQLAAQAEALQTLREEAPEYSPVQAVNETGSPYVNVPLKGLADIKIVQMPELVELARDLMRSLPELKRLPRARGLFMPMGQGTIRLDPRIFSDPISAAKTMAHEIGHLIDYLPDKTMKRGNLHGRLHSLRSFLKDHFGAAWYSNKDLRKELIALTRYWKPYDPATDPPGYVRYRESAVELYADALSVLFNSPATLKQMAPKFYAEFWRGLDSKPEVKKTFFELQAWLSRPMMEQLGDRARKVDVMFAKGQEIFERKWQEREERYKGFRGWLSRLKQGFFDNYAPIRDRELAAGRAGDFDAARFLFDEHPLADNLVYRWLERMQRTVIALAEEAGFSMDDIGRLLFYHRVAHERYKVSTAMAAQLGVNAGGRSVIANPQGHTRDTARFGLLHMRLENGIRGQTLLQAAVDRFHDMVFEVMKEAHAVGLFSDKQMKLIAANRDNYATFTPLEFVDLFLPSGLFPQAGTLREITNPFVATVSKLLTLHRAIQHQRTKAKAVQILRRDFPGEIERAVTAKDALGRETPRKPRERGIAQIMLREAGHPAWYNVPREIALMFERADIPLMESALQVLDVPFRKFFYPLFITFNPVFQLVRNPIRDARRTYIDAPSGVGFWAIARQLPLVKQIGPNPALDGVRALVKEGKQTPLIAEMLDNLAITPGEATFNATLGRPATSFDRLLQQFGVLPHDEQAGFRATKLPWIGPVLKGIENAGRMNELLPKANVYRLLTEKLGWHPREAAFYVRNYVGTPAYTRRGKHIRLLNPIVPFINIWMKGWAADIELARRGYKRADRPDVPGKSAASFWFRWAMTSGIWTVLKVAAGLGLLGLGVKKVMDGISDYDKTNYDVIPIGRSGTSDFDAGGKVVFIPVPKDPTDRVVSGILYNALRSAGVALTRTGALGEELKAANADVQLSAGEATVNGLNVAANDMPGLNPMLKLAGAWTSYLVGQNPVDSFRGSFVLSDKEHLAGGWDSAKPMLAWTYKQTGLSNFLSFDPTAGMTLEQSVHLPLVNGMVKVSDYGFREKQNEHERAERAAKARVSLGMPANAQRLASEYSFLRGLGTADRTPAQEERYRELSAWHKTEYMPVEKQISDGDENGLTPELKKVLLRELETASKAIERPR